MFERNWKVRFSECDSERKLRYEGIVNYFQDCSNLQSEDGNAGIKYLEKKNRAWLMDFWQIVINRRPDSFENIRVSTWANGFKGFFGTRNFLMRDENEEVLVCANSYWIYLDTISGHPVKVPQEEIDNYQPEEPYNMEYVGRKIDIPDELDYVEDVMVKQHHLDLYNHMNNANYIQIASDYVPEDAEVWQICCQYKKQARKGDILKIYRKIEEKRIIIVLKDTEDSIYTTISYDIK